MNMAWSKGSKCLRHAAFHKCHYLASQDKQLTAHPSSTPQWISSPFLSFIFFLVCLSSGAPNVMHIPIFLLLALCVLSCFWVHLRFSRWDRVKEREHLHWYVCVYIFCLRMLRVTSPEREEGRGRSKENSGWCERQRRRGGQKWRERRERRRERKTGNRDSRLRDPERQDGLGGRDIRKRQRNPRKTKEAVSKETMSGLPCGLVNCFGMTSL